MKTDKQLNRLKTFLKNSKSLSQIEITKFLGWSDKYKKSNRIILKKWCEEGELIKNKKNRYNIPENLGFIKGKFSNIKNKFGFVDTENEGYFIPKNRFSNALDGDTVLIKVTNENNNGKKEGEIVKIILREKTTVVGVFQKKDNFGFVIPSQSFGRDIYIPRNYFNGAKDGDLVVIKVTFWGDSDKKPEGKIIRSLGNPLNSNNLIEALIQREDMSENFPDDVIAETKFINKKISQQDIVERVDLRHLPIITIDGADAKDLDDAVYVEKIEDKFKLIVSIADVSHYIKTGSQLDKEAEKRGNSVYLVDRVLPMFPKEISNGICSLNLNEDKLTFSVEIIFNNSGAVIDVKTYKSIISSSFRMTYSDVNKIIEKDKKLTSFYSDIVPMIFSMLELSKLLRKIKHDRGAIDFNIPEIKIILDDNKKVKYLKTVERGESEKIIEDFMISANEAVAEKLFWLEIPSVYRIHETPDIDRIKTLNESLVKFGYHLHNLETIHPKQFQSIIEDSESKGTNMIIHKMILTSLKQAKYDIKNLGHFGLSSSYYTHFTSPIRRYADLLVHRILDSVSKGYPTKKQFGKLLKYLPEVTAHISKTERKAMQIEDESIKIKVVEYMLNKIGEEFKATIIGFSNTKIFFETDEHIECFWDLTTAQNFYEFNEQNYIMKDIDTGREFSLGDKTELLIVRADMRLLEIEAIPVEFFKDYVGDRKEKRFR